MSLVLLLAAYLCLWPVPIEAVSWDAPAPSGLNGAQVVNDRLAAAHRIALGGEAGPEHVTAGPDGKLYVSVASGSILRISSDGEVRETFTRTGGRPLGTAFDAGGRLIVADALRGLLSVAPNGAVVVLVKAGPGEALSFPNALAIAADGRIFLTDSSARFTPARWGSTQAAALLDVLEQSATGRVLEFDPASGRLRVVATGLSLANGIVLSADERSLLVSESGRYRVWKLDAGLAQADVAQRPPGVVLLLDGLPGFPDNLTRGRDGRIWLGLAGPRNALDALAGKPFARELLLRIPRGLWPQQAAPGRVIAFTEDGHIVDDLQGRDGHSSATSGTTGATEVGGRLYLHTIEGSELAWLPLQPGAWGAIRARSFQKE